MGSSQTKYTLPSPDNFIGKGTFGEVYRCRRKADNCVVAVKIIGKVNDTVMNEIHKLKLLSKDPHCHPNIVCIYDHFRFENKVAIVMEYVSGHELDLIEFKNPKHYYQAFWEFAKGLQYLHEKNVVHRDIKPENAKLNGEQLKILDFGLSCYENECQLISGTPSYIDPMLFIKLIPSSNFKSDIYACGLTFFVILTKKYPRHLKSRTDYYNRNTFTNFYIDNIKYLEHFLRKSEYDQRLLPLLERMMSPYNAAVRPDINEVVQTLEDILKK